MGNQPSGAAGAAAPAASASSSSASASSVSYTSTQANGTGTQTQARKPAGTVVILNIYEPSKPQQSMPGFGIYHTGIELNGTEYSFAGGPEAGSGTGVMSQVPRAMPAGGEWKFKQSLELGTVTIPLGEFDRVLNELKDLFLANQYNLVHRNCNHFTTACAARLGLSSKYPSWVNRAASWGSVFVAPPPGLTPMPEPAKPKESVFKSTTGYRMNGPPAAAAAAASSQPKQKETKKDEQKPSASPPTARKNPWADPKFIPPGMRNDPIVSGAIPAKQ